MSSKTTTEQKLRGGMIMIVILSLCLVMTSYALMSVTLDIKNNRFFTGAVNINLNDGKTIISDENLLFEPGMLIEREFFIRNEDSDDAPSSGPVYYKIYFDYDNESGILADMIEVTITSTELTGPGARTAGTFFNDRRSGRVQGTILYHGKLSDYTRNNKEVDPLTAKDVLDVGEQRNFYMYFYFPTDIGNEAMNLRATFDICAEAVQAKNNPNADF